MSNPSPADSTNGSDRSDELVSSRHRTLRPHGGYRRLRSFQVAEVIYDATVTFCDRFVNKRSRTHDQMVQAARSGRQNIAEGSRASGTSSQTELRLVGVARASLEELLLDYEDYLRQRSLSIWDKDDPRALHIRAMGKASRDRTDRTDPTDPMIASGYSAYRPLVEDGDAETAANTAICLINQANYLLDRQIAALERDFIWAGGYTEQLADARRLARSTREAKHRSDQSDPSDPTDRITPTAAPDCPRCGQPMVLRTARKGYNASSRFWGCSAFPDCKGTRAAEKRGSR